ncbi:MAG: hypothetical protein ACYDEX_07590 [Mobilitalea sp.]
MEKPNYALKGAVCAFVYVLLSGPHNLFEAILLVIIGAVLGIGKGYVTVNQEEETKKI